ncbi:3-deoxy-manno-octulosonate cytidylyltransferase [Breoghania sp.]|uniref:3-deoxy-manno-octulosonate cytidylyltransferase n=1 Tax=Breoghania sp. TaxID=2065378 RepID=UPI0029CA5472|nr:3-deoxy-manno-octulosonate cytidylyltransferase [Breoghania sp.]
MPAYSDSSNRRSRVLVVIPARMESTRLPGKPLADIDGKPMIVQVLERAREADIGPVVVAADDARIITVVEAAGGRAVMTRKDHASGSDRVREAVQIADPDCDLILNLQGDVPLIDPLSLRAAIDPLKDRNVDIGTIMTEIRDEEGRVDPGFVKAVTTPLGGDRHRALYFTRATAPYGDGPLYQHIGVYAWRRAALEKFVALPSSTLEKREKLEQLRALEAGMRIDVSLVPATPMDVNTPVDLERVRAAFARMAREAEKA